MTEEVELTSIVETVRVALMPPEFRPLQSESLDEYFKAYIKLEAALPYPIKDGKGHNYIYMTWGALKKAIDPVLTKAGFILQLQVAGEGDGAVCVFGRLIHVESGQWIGSFIRDRPQPERMNFAQATGSLLTFYKRYLTEILLGIASEDDDGSNAGETGGPRKTAARKQASPPQAQRTRVAAAPPPAAAAPPKKAGPRGQGSPATVAAAIAPDLERVKKINALRGEYSRLINDPGGASPPTNEAKTHLLQILTTAMNNFLAFEGGAKEAAAVLAETVFATKLGDLTAAHVLTFRSWLSDAASGALKEGSVIVMKQILADHTSAQTQAELLTS